VPGVPDLLARIDLLTMTDEALVVTDFKTARSRWSSDHADEAGEQLLLYGELARRLTPDKPVAARFVVLTKTKLPAVECYPVGLDPRRIERTRRVVARIWRAIEAGHFYPSPSPIACGSCPFCEPCRAWSG